MPVRIGGVEKMAKSKNNGVDPQVMVDRYGADTVRLFSMFAAPPELSLDWRETGVEGMARFLRRMWREIHAHIAKGPAGKIDAGALGAEQKAMRRQVHETIAKVSDDIGRRYTFNTAIAAVMELLNALAKFADDTAQGRAVRQEAWTAVVLLLNPITPHISHHLWQALGHGESLVENQPWPQADPAALVRDAAVLAIQVNGKLRGQIEVPIATPKDEIERLAMADGHVQKFIAGQTVKKVIVVPGKIVNIVVG
jgi:leucyl-tRNA synthetase